MMRLVSTVLLALSALVLTVPATAEEEASAGGGIGRNMTIPLSVAPGLERPIHHDLLLLRSGETLKGTILNEGFSLHTAYGAVGISNDLIAAIDLGERKGNQETFITANNNRLSGFLEDRVVHFQMRSGAPITIRRDKIRRAVFHQRSADPAGFAESQFLLLRNGDVISGRITNESVAVINSYARIPLSMTDVKSIALDDARGTEIIITMSNGDVIRGALEAQRIEVALDIGGTIEVWDDRVEGVFTQDGIGEALAERGAQPPLQLGMAD